MLSTKIFRKLFKRNMLPASKVSRSYVPYSPERLRENESSTDQIEYVETHTKHQTVLAMYDLFPYFDDNYIAPSATVAGEVMIHSYATIWNNVVIRGDINSVTIGSYTSIGDGTVIQTVASLPTGLLSEVIIERNVTIHSDCSLSSCIIEPDVVVGAKSVICEGARLEKGCMIAPGSVVPPGRLIPSNQLWAGNPVEYVKDLDIGELMTNYSLSYVNTTVGNTVKGINSLYFDKLYNYIPNLKNKLYYCSLEFSYD